MRCKCCDTLLNHYEMSLVDSLTTEPLDTCELCLVGNDITMDDYYDIDVDREDYDAQ
jgi:hypothetical protein